MNDASSRDRRRHPALVLPYAGISPVFGGALRFAGAGCAVLGRVTAAPGLALGPSAVIRADGETVTIGEDVWLGEDSTVHIAHDLHATVIGDRVTAGRNAVIHACRVGRDCVIEDDVVILDASTVEDGVVVAAGSTVFPRSTLARDGLYAGSPAKRVGTLSDEDRRMRAGRLRAALEASVAAAPGGAGEGPPRGVHFVADTAVLRGAVELAPGASVFFGCRLDARRASIRVGDDTDIQDNCVLRGGTVGIAIGRETTLGHNVRLEDATVGDRCLVGIGAVLAPGTVVANDVLVAAGTGTEAGQALEAGWLWAGRPAKPLRRLDESRKAMMATTVAQYRAYARDYRAAQERLARDAGTRGPPR